MDDQVSVATEILAAIGHISDNDRTTALRRIASRFSQPQPEQLASSTLYGDNHASLHQQKLASIYDQLREAARCKPFDELDIVDFIRTAQELHLTCALSLMFGLPAKCIEMAFNTSQADLLLIVCRAQNFAWSNVRFLLGQSKISRSAADIEALIEVYHEIPLAQARRFGRFLNVHFAPMSGA